MPCKILGETFYFIRHGETYHNYAGLTSDQPKNAPLNQRGIHQVQMLRPLLSRIAIRTICSSPLKRAQETARILSEEMRTGFQTIEDFTECSISTWNEMLAHNSQPLLPSKVHHFVEHIHKGIKLALSFPGPVLVVAHGGCYWALCYLLGIKPKKWTIENCILMKFSCDPMGSWSVSRLL